MTASRSPIISFATDITPLPLIGPLAAAKRLQIAPHSLACYRSLGRGPAYYKFGRSVFYLTDDLDAWQWQVTRIRGHLPPSPLVHSDTLFMLTPRDTAKYLMVTKDGLASMRRSRNGPPHRHWGRRIVYEFSELQHWASEQRVENRASSRR